MRCWSWRHVVLACAATLAALWLLSAGLTPAVADPPAIGDSMAPNPPAEPPPPVGAVSTHDTGPPTGADSFKAVEGDGGGGGGNFGNPGGSSGGPNVEIPGLLPNDQPQGPSISPNEIIVVLPSTMNRSAGAAFAADHNSTVVDYFRLPGLNAHVFLLSLRDAAQFGQRFKNMTQDPRPVWVQPNPAFATSPSRKLSSTDPKPNIGLQYALTQVHIEPVLDVTRGGGVPVAMVDSGVAVKHEALAEASISILDVIAKPNEVLTVATPEGHGTAIASIIVGHGQL